MRKSHGTRYSKLTHPRPRVTTRQTVNDVEQISKSSLKRRSFPKRGFQTMLLFLLLEWNALAILKNDEKEDDLSWRNN